MKPLKGFTLPTVNKSSQVRRTGSWSPFVAILQMGSLKPLEVSENTVPNYTAIALFALLARAKLKAGQAVDSRLKDLFGFFGIEVRDIKDPDLIAVAEGTAAVALRQQYAPRSILRDLGAQLTQVSKALRAMASAA